MNSYLRTWSFLLGIGLGILWIIGLSTPNATPWLTWLDGLAAISAFVLAAGVRDQSGRNVSAGGPLALAVGLYALWIIGLATDGTLWQDWWNFGFACAFLLMAIGGSRRAVTGRVSEAPSDIERFRKSA